MIATSFPRSSPIPVVLRRNNSRSPITLKFRLTPLGKLGMCKFRTSQFRLGIFIGGIRRLSGESVEVRVLNRFWWRKKSAIVCVDHYTFEFIFYSEGTIKINFSLIAWSSITLESHLSLWKLIRFSVSRSSINNKIIALFFRIFKVFFISV